MNMAKVSGLRALSVAGVLLALAPLDSGVMAQPAAVSAPAAAGATLAALRTAEHGDLRPVEALLANKSTQGLERYLLEARHASAFLRFDEAWSALDRYFAGQDTDQERLFVAHEVAAGAALLSGEYGKAARHAQTLLAMSAGKPKEKVENIRRVQEIGAQLANVSAQIVEVQGNGTPVSLVRDKVGLLRSPITIGAIVQDAVLDTGAGVSVVSASEAERLGLRMLEGAASVGNSVGTGVDIRLGIAERLEVGGAVVRNVVFAVMDDAALTFPVPGGYKIDAILGIPVLRAIGRVEFNLGQKAVRVSPAPAVSQEAANMRVIGSSPYVMMTIAGLEQPLFFDTGANSTALFPRFAAMVPGLQPIAEGRMAGKAGAGGVKHMQSMKIHNVPVSIGRHSANIPSLSYEPDGSDDPDVPFGVLGIDLLSRFETFAIDYTNMVLEVGRPLAPAAAASAAR